MYMYALALLFLVHACTTFTFSYNCQAHSNTKGSVGIRFCGVSFIIIEGGIFLRYNGTASNLTARRFSVHWRLLDDKIKQDTEHIILGGSAICLRPHPNL
jgi:hypothetical protein